MCAGEGPFSWLLKGIYSLYILSGGRQFSGVYSLTSLHCPVSSCRLEELFLCLNEYSSLSASGVACPSLRLLHITDNSLQDWAEVRKFGSMFPSLDTLVMSNNNLASIQDNKDVLQRLFPNLRSINLHNSGQVTRLFDTVDYFTWCGNCLIVVWFQ